MSKRQRPYTGRDWNLVRLIQGATKAAVHTDKKKERDKYLCREYSDADGFDAELPTEGGGQDHGGWEGMECSETSGSRTS